MLTAFLQFKQAEILRLISGWLTAGLGANLIYCMVRVYRFKTIPAWKGWRVLIGFFVSALLLGQLLVISILTFAGFHPVNNAYFAIPYQSSAWGIEILLGIQLALALSARQPAHRWTRRLRSGLILSGIGLGFALTIIPNPIGTWLVFGVTLLEEALGRWLFYQSRNRLM